MVVAAMLATSCAGSSDDTSAESEPTSAPALVTPAGSDGAPDEIALVDPELVIEGAAAIQVAAGETVTVHHAVHNQSDADRSLGFRHRHHGDADAAEPGGAEPFEVELSHTTIRVDAQEVLALTSVVEVPDDAAPGDVLAYDVVVVDVDDITRRHATTVELTVAEAEGVRPQLGADTGVTTTNKTVLVYVVGDDRDPDGDLDLASLRVVAGGFRADEATSTVAGTVTYVPFANVTGTDIVIYELCDHEGRCSTAPLTILVED